MKKLFESYNLIVNDKQLMDFESYYNLLIEYNNKFNLTAITQKKEVYVKHFIDSLLGYKQFKSGKVIDIGSGGGFPAIPLAIYLEDLDITMLEATGKKCLFLNEVIKKLNLKNAKVINGRAEELAKNNEFRERFDYATARAVARLNILSEFCLPFIKIGGSFIAYKADAMEEIEQSNTAINLLGGKIENINNYNLEDAKRCLILVKKVKNTPQIYPRSNGKIRKSPL